MILDRVLQPRNEVITTSAGLEQFLRGAGVDTWSGESINSDKAMRLITVYACIKIISEGIAKLPLHVLERDKVDRRKSTPAFDLEIYELLHYQPNEIQTSYQFFESWVASAVLRGNGYAFINRVRGEIVELLPIHPDRVEPKLDDKWIVTYKVTQSDGRVTTHPRSEIMHLKGFGEDPLVGVNPIQLHRETLGENKALLRHSAQTFGNGARPGGVLEHPGSLTKEAQARLQEQLDSRVGGENSGKTLVLEEGMEWKQIGLSAVDAQYIEQQKFSRSQIAVMFGVKPHLVGDLDRAIQSNIEEQSRGHVVDTLLPWIVRIEGILRRDLLKENSPDLFAKIIVEGLLRGNSKDRANYYTKLTGAGIYTRNEVRALEDYNPIDGLDEPLTPLNMSEGSNEEPEDDDE